MQRLTTNEFIDRANVKHAGRYTYADALYIGARSRVTVTCPEHGNFSVGGGPHLQGTGCAKCARAAQTRKQTLTTEAFIQKAKAVHGQLTYDYACIDYTGGKQKVAISCKTHGSFLQSPQKHLAGQGCKKCANARTGKRLTGGSAVTARLTTATFIERARAKHGDLYDYSLSSYMNCAEKVTIACREHGAFQMSPAIHINQGSGCQRCASVKRSQTQTHTQEQFLAMARDKHGSTYSYDKAIYVRMDKSVIITCRVHGDFEQIPHSHLKGCGCPTCGGRQKYTTETWIQKAIGVHGDRYNYDRVLYTLAEEKVKIECKAHGIFEQIPYCHLQGAGCQICGMSAAVSKAQIDWLEYEMMRSNINIQHALNGGEFRIPGTRCQADGYAPSTKTVYELYGSYFHGCPRIYKAGDMNGRVNKTFGQLYSATMAREAKINDLGYNIVVMWEIDWRLFVFRIKRIQRRVKKWLKKRHTGDLDVRRSRTCSQKCDQLML